MGDILYHIVSLSCYVTFGEEGTYFFEPLLPFSHTEKYNNSSYIKISARTGFDPMKSI